MFIVVLFTMAKIWKQTKCPTTNEWINKIWSNYAQWNTIELLYKMKSCLCHNVDGARDVPCKLK